MAEIRTNDSLRDEEKHKEMETPVTQGEQSVGGDVPDLESDDDVTEMEHEAGLYLEEDEEHPQEAGLGEQVEKAEEEHDNS